MGLDDAVQKAPNQTVRIGRGQIEILRHLTRVRKIEYSKLIQHLMKAEAITNKQRSEITVNGLVKTAVLERKGDTLRLTTVGRKLLEVLEVILSNHVNE